MNPVFGTCVHVDAARGYAFFRVEGEIDDGGHFIRLNASAARRHFPNRGTIRTSRLPANSRYGSFTLELDARFERHSDDHNATKFRGLPTASLLYQILPVDERSEAAEAVGDKLRSGVKILAEAVSRPSIFVLFSDDVLCGPISMKAIPERSDYFLMEQQEWAQPKAAWRGVTTRDLVYINVPHLGETSFATLPVHDPNTYLDFAKLDFSLRKVLESVHQLDGASKHLPNANVRELSVALAKITPSPDLKLRIEALRNRVSTLEASSHFSEILQDCLKLPAVETRIKDEANKAKQAALVQIAHEINAATKLLESKRAEMENASAEISSLLERKTYLETEAQKAEADIESSKKRFAEAVAKATLNAEKDVFGFLAQVAVFRPFFTEGPSQPRATTPRSPFAIQRFTNDATSIHDPAEAVKKLRDALKSVGVDPRTAFNASAEIVAALCIGQGVAFRGSLSVLASNLTAQVLAGGTLATVEIPVGTRSQLGLRDLTPDGSANIPQALGVIINGANRSCVDAYGGELLDRIKMRLSGALKRSAAPHVLLSLREGPSTLRPTPQLAEIAPILHTDLWNWTPRQEPSQPVFFQFQTESKSEQTNDTAEALDAIRLVYKDLPSGLFGGCVRSVLPVLVRLYQELHTSRDKAQEAAIYSLVNSWLLPFLLSNRAPEEKIEACMDLTKTDAELQRHVKLLKASEEC